MELVINNYSDREALCIALINAGYTVRWEKRKIKNSYNVNYVVVITDHNNTKKEVE